MKQFKKVPIIFSFALFLSYMLALVPTQALAQGQLSEVALFYRCYGHIAQIRPKFNDTLLAEVKSGAKTAVQACNELLETALLSANGGTQIADTNDETAKSILKTFHHLHRSWSREQLLFNPKGSQEDRGTRQWFEDAPFGAYVTRALFSPSFNVDSVTSGSDYLQPLRTDNAPAQDSSGRPNANEIFYFGTTAIAPRGDLIGIQSRSITPIDHFGTTRLSESDLPDPLSLDLPPTVSVVIPNLDIRDADVRAPLAGVTEENGDPVVDHFAIQVEGVLRVPVAGQYRLFGQFDDYTHLYLDNVLIFDDSPGGTNTGAEISSDFMQLEARDYSVLLKWYERTGSERIYLRWEGPGISKQFIPESAFFHANNGSLNSGLRADYYHLRQNPTVKLTGSEGGGFLGNHNYLLTTFQENEENFFGLGDGALFTNRTWTRAYLNDVLCRDVPVVREADVVEWVVPDSDTPFRQAAACVTCHATLDRSAGVIRGLGWNLLPTDGNDDPIPDLLGMNTVHMHPATRPVKTDWPDTPDALWSKRQPYGHFYFRNYRGELIDVIVNSVEDVGQAIRAQDDYYVCFAKRYYHYFTGIDVVLGDPGDPTYPQLSAPDIFHQQQVVDMGLRLKQHKNLRTLINEIISSAQYRMTDYGITFAGGEG